jgi:hypothetical protein
MNMGDSAPATATESPLADEREGGPEAPAPRRTVWTVFTGIVTGIVGGIVGLAPHVLHHVGPLVGTALIAGSGGKLLFGFIGLVASIPMLIKLRRRFANWWAPGIALVVFAAMFLVSSFVLGPLISAPDKPATQVMTGVGHAGHHSKVAPTTAP